MLSRGKGHRFDHCSVHHAPQYVRILIGAVEIYRMPRQRSPKVGGAFGLARGLIESRWDHSVSASDRAAVAEQIRKDFLENGAKGRVRKNSYA